MSEEQENETRTERLLAKRPSSRAMDEIIAKREAQDDPVVGFETAHKRFLTRFSDVVNDPAMAAEVRRLAVVAEHAHRKGESFNWGEKLIEAGEHVRKNRVEK